MDSEAVTPSAPDAAAQGAAWIRLEPWGEWLRELFTPEAPAGWLVVEALVMLWPLWVAFGAVWLARVGWERLCRPGTPNRVTTRRVGGPRWSVPRTLVAVTTGGGEAVGPEAIDARAEEALPRTHATLAADLQRLGVAAGSTVLLHSSLRAVGWVCGGSVAVVRALLNTVGTAGTLVVPTQTPEYSDPAGWRHPPVPEAWWPVIRRELPAFDPRVTPSRHMGLIAETVRTWPGAHRSAHPAVSFAALGAGAAALLRDHPLDDGLGDASPLGALYRGGAGVLLLGVGYESATAFHLAQYRLPRRADVDAGAPVLEHGRRVWRRYRDIEWDSEPFAALGAAFERTGPVRRGRAGEAEARYFPLREAVDFAVTWLGAAAPA